MPWQNGKLAQQKHSRITGEKGWPRRLRVAWPLAKVLPFVRVMQYFFRALRDFSFHRLEWKSKPPYNEGGGGILNTPDGLIAELGPGLDRTSVFGFGSTQAKRSQTRNRTFHLLFEPDILTCLRRRAVRSGKPARTAPTMRFRLKRWLERQTEFPSRLIGPKSIINFHFT
jgi:hypothetical protein